MEDLLDLELVALTHPDALERLKAVRLILEQLDEQMLDSIREARTPSSPRILSKQPQSLQEPVSQP
jgi:hypothetical protein